jgi:hypothetical protein
MKENNNGNNNDRNNNNNNNQKKDFYYDLNGRRISQQNDIINVSSPDLHFCRC